MVLPGSPPQSNAGTNKATRIEDYYSEEDVAILHDIVSLAQELLPSLPERERLPTSALFKAYYDIMPRLGFDVDHDSRYARVLFKIGGIGGLRDQRTLYEKFEEVLRNMGIEILFDGSDEGSQYEEAEDDRSDIEVFDEFEEQRQDGGRRRRNSESSVWAPPPETRPRRDSTRRNSHSYGDQLEEQSQHNEVSRQDILDQLQAERPIESIETKENENRNAGTWVDSQYESPRKSNHGGPGSAHGSMRIRRRSNSRGRPRSIVDPSEHGFEGHRERREPITNTFYFEDDNMRDSEPRSSNNFEASSVAASESLMQVKASVILEDHLKFLAKRQLRQWRDRAVQLREDNIGLNTMARHFSKRTLCHAVMVVWRPRALDLRKARETEIFFESMHIRVDNARKVYLKQTAFNHWSVYAGQHVRRTELARRHIVRLRMFNAWHEITVVNELKVRRQVIKKFFSVWRQHHDNVFRQGNFALQHYEGGLLQRVLRDWIQKRKEDQAKALWAGCAKRRILFHWIVVSHEAWELQRTSDVERQSKLRWSAFATWHSNTRVRLQQMDEAGARYRDNLVRNMLYKWRKETYIIPATAIVQTEVARRLKQDTFRIWRQRALQEKMAASVNRSKILREALTLWRYQVRIKIVTDTIAARMKKQAIHKLVRTHRSIDADRKFEQKRLRETLRIWVLKSQQSRDHSLEQEDLARTFLVQRSQNLALAQWYSRMGHRKSLEVTALERYEPRLLGGILSKWSEQSQHQQQLQEWSRNAEFYFLANKSLKRWKASTESARREKRKTAFAELRHRVKINLVRGVLQSWREQARYITDLQQQASSVRENRNVILGMEIFDRWRGRTEEVAELESLARETVLKKQLSLWREKFDGLHALETEAIITYQERRQSRAIRKWSLAALQIRAQSNYAADISEMNAKKIFRKMFNYWHQKSLQRRPSQRVETSESDQLLGTTARAETWSEFGGEEDGNDDWARGLDGATSSTPIPGYLATPSKVNRAERVMAVAARFSTTPKAPLSTPFERRLRAQYSGGQVSLRRGFARSTLGMGGGFADIAENSNSLNNSLNNERESGGV